MNEPRNILLTLKYDGTAYHGYQVQKNAVTVCGVFQDSVEALFGERLDVKGCSRTDTGVHALDYKISFITTNNIPLDRIFIALNALLPDDIAVIKVQNVPLNFHPRYHVIAKEYIYKIHNSTLKNPFSRNHSYFYHQPIDVTLLNDCAEKFVGTHDFTTFSANSNVAKNRVRTIYSFSVDKIDDEVRFIVKGSGFLHNMVRILVGTLISVNEGRIMPKDIISIIQSKNRERAGKTMPAHGLYLSRVDYHESWVI